MLCAGRLTIAAICCVVLSVLSEPAGSFAASPAYSAASPERLRLGERIYREGVLPSGKPLKTSSKDGLSVPGTSFPCVSCHLRSGLGALSDGILTPPTNGAKLFKPLRFYSLSTSRSILINSTKAAQQLGQKGRITHRRPNYTDESLTKALRNGIDSAGRIMNDIMPRYLLDDDDMQLLISYLKSLSSEFSPGVSKRTLRLPQRGTETTLHFATIIADDVSLSDQTAMLMPLNNFISSKNLSIDSGHGIGDRSTDYGSRFAEEATKGEANLRLSLSRWALKGPPETWRNQLEKYYLKEPVFAILGGMTSGEWQPVHRFCEENQIPCIFPITDFPVISQTDWYTLYFSKGYYQEGEGAANFLNDQDELKSKPILQIVRDTREGRALSSGFLESWRDYGQQAPVTVMLKAGETLSAELLRQQLAQEKPAAIILWDGTESFKTLELLASENNRPAMVLVSSGFLGKSMFSLDEKSRDFTYITYPYRIPLSREEKSLLPKDRGQSSMKRPDFTNKVEENSVATNRIWQQSYILTMTLHMALDDLRGNYYRDNLLDVIGTNMDQEIRLYERFSFGPGQRYASRGCFIVQLTKDGLVKKSEWLTH